MDSSRDQILDAAEHLFGTHGYANVSIHQVCAESGLPVGSVYHHFGSKAGVLRAVLKRGMGSFFDALPTFDDLEGSPVERLAEHYAIAGDLIAKRLALFRLFASLQLHQAENEEVRTIVDASVQCGFTRVLDFIEAVAGNCGVRDSAECARELATLNIVFTTGLVTTGGDAGLDVVTGISRHLHRLILASIMDRATGSPPGG
ncbi:TetR/AcrR family transcriptional regulator [Streptomyces sp. VNUA24]|uniref:TetR/AcrR family transcriptional regulator n=1 Tax=Streptomyces sp. VNUA24 TaxID=3031131 RepID=UPI0023B85B6C|nr:TetR/AcrR family transcriptional regulator [Streptomyces sp. VNUA24]WEH12968.1 TetR/AcrR family transcriptional regulator [Streptomyces sp. VNUA24]